MADSQGVPNNPSEYTTVINWLNAHPGYSSGWDRFRAEHGDMADLGNVIQIAIAAAQGRAESERVWLYFGGNWDTYYGRSPGDPWAGSVQKLGAEILWGATQGGSPPQQPAPTPPGSPGAPIGTPAAFGRLLSTLQAHPYLSAGGILVALMIFGRRQR